MANGVIGILTHDTPFLLDTDGSKPEETVPPREYTGLGWQN